MLTQGRLEGMSGLGQQRMGSRSSQPNLSLFFPHFNHYHDNDHDNDHDHNDHNDEYHDHNDIDHDDQDHGHDKDHDDHDHGHDEDHDHDDDDDDHLPPVYIPCSNNSSAALRMQLYQK